MLYLFSKIKPTAYIPINQFPELAPLKDHWETIRQEALSLNADGQLLRLRDITIWALILFFGLAGNDSIFAGMAKKCPRLPQLAQKP